MGRKCRYCHKRPVEECSLYCSAECMALWLDKNRDKIRPAEPADGIAKVNRELREIEIRTGKRISYGELMARGKTDGD